MPRGWNMSAMWMPAPGQTWPGAAGSFLGMWITMMVAMMLPSLVPMLRRYRQAVGGMGEPRLGWLTAVVGAGYFFFWTLSGVAIFPFGLMWAEAETWQPSLAQIAQIVAGLAVLIAGAFQFTRWKARHLACCREAPLCASALPADSNTAWRQGLRFGLHCGQSCANLMAILIVLGTMDLRAMTFVTAAITVERLAPGGQRAARVVGAIATGLGLLLVARAAGLK